MILTVNIENTKIFIGCADAEKRRIFFEESVSADQNKTAVEYTILMKQILDLHGIRKESITGGIVASCVPQLTSVVKQAAGALLHKEILEVGPGMKTGVNIRIDDPGELGADLLTAAAAGIVEYGAPLVIVSLGTAGAVCVIDGQKIYRGGMLFPGIRMSLESLSNRTAILPDVAIQKPQKLIGSTTVESMQSGVIIGNAALIDGMIDRITEELETEPEVVVTGEFAPLITPYCRHMLLVDEHLIMKGLIIIYQKNCRSARG